MAHFKIFALFPESLDLLLRRPDLAIPDGLGKGGVDFPKRMLSG
jgi:hypothetical protein